MTQIRTYSSLIDIHRNVHNVFHRNYIYCNNSWEFEWRRTSNNKLKEIKKTTIGILAYISFIQLQRRSTEVVINRLRKGHSKNL